MKTLALLLALMVTLPPAAHADALDGLIGKKRVVLLFAKSRSNAALDKQVELLRERRPDLSERDMVVLVSEGREDTIAVIGYASLDTGTARQLRNRFDPSAAGLTGVLLGKDGGEKLRWTRPVEPDELFDLIDSMPMRQSEMEAATN